MIPGGRSQPIPYTSICDLLVWHLGNHRAIAVIQAFLDDGGSADTSTLSIGGALAPEDAWRNFERSWFPLLNSHDGMTVFHMTDLMVFKGIYKHGWDVERRRKLVNSLLTFIEYYLDCYVAVSSRELHTGYKRYHEAGITCGHYLMRQIEQYPKEEKLEIIFEQTKGFTGVVKTTLESKIDTPGWERLAAVNVATKKVPSLHAADLLVYLYQASKNGHHDHDVKNWIVRFNKRNRTRLSA